MKNTELLNFGNYPEIKADELGDVQIRWRNIQFYFASWRKIDGVWRRVVTGFAELPCDALPAEHIAKWRKTFPPAPDAGYIGLAH